MTIPEYMSITEKMNFYDETSLSREFSFDIEDISITIDNTGENPNTRFTFNEGDKVKVIIQRDFAFVMKMTKHNFYLSILNIGVEGEIKANNLSWKRDASWLTPKVEESEDIWPGHIALLLVSDLESGSPTFVSPYIHKIGFIVRKCAMYAKGVKLTREFQPTGLKISLYDGCYNVTGFDDETLFLTSDFRKLTNANISRLLYQSMKKSA